MLKQADITGALTLFTLQERRGITQHPQGKNGPLLHNLVKNTCSSAALSHDTIRFLKMLPSLGAGNKIEKLEIRREVKW